MSIHLLWHPLRSRMKAHTAVGAEPVVTFKLCGMTVGGMSDLPPPTEPFLYNYLAYSHPRTYHCLT